MLIVRVALLASFCQKIRNFCWVKKSETGHKKVWNARKKLALRFFFGTFKEYTSQLSLCNHQNWRHLSGVSSPSPSKVTLVPACHPGWMSICNTFSTCDKSFKIWNMRQQHRSNLHCSLACICDMFGNFPFLLTTCNRSNYQTWICN